MRRPAAICFLILAIGLLPVARGLSEGRNDSPGVHDSIPGALPGVVPADSMHSETVSAAPTKSPGLALLLSAALPGAGQFYNESYWKVPVVLGFGVYFTSQWLHYNRLTSEARDRYSASLLLDAGGDATQLALREFYKDRRDSYTWYLLILYVLNLADAYVDASLYDFDVGEDLSLRLVPEQGGRIGVRLEF